MRPPTRRAFLAGTLGALALGRARAQEPERPTILVLTGDEGERTTTIASTFKKTCDYAARMSYLVGNEADAGAFIADNIRGQPLSLVFAIGTLAAKVALREFSSTPVIYADVPPDAPISPGTNAIGVTTRLDPGASLERLLKLLPGMRELGFLSAAPRDPYWPAASEAAAGLGMRTTLRQIGSPDEVPNAFLALTGPTEMVWLQEEGRIWTGGALSRVFHEATIQRFPLVAFSRTHLDAANPPPLVIYPHPVGVGEVASKMARSLVLGDPMPAIVGVPPLFAGHARAMRAAGLVVSAKSTEALDELVGR